MHIFYFVDEPLVACEYTDCLREGDILCDLCNRECCKHHSYEWSYPNTRGYDHPPQKIICEDCAMRLRESDQALVTAGDPDEDPGRLRRRDGIVWQDLRA